MSQVRHTQGNTAYLRQRGGQAIVFPGAYITDRGVLKGTGATAGTGLIHLSTFQNGLSELEHEYGHFLQALMYGQIAYNGIIVPASIWSASTNSSDHHNFWTEQDANAWATCFFGLNSAIGRNSFYPKKFSFLFNKLK